MLNKYELTYGILIAWVISLIIYIFLQLKHRNQLPEGSIIIEKSMNNNTETQYIPGTKLSRNGLLIGLGINSLMYIIAIIFYWFEIGINKPILIINLPRWMNWLGIVLIWIYYYWGVKVMQFNVNYLPLYKPLPNKYILATGGPYRLVRHPMYLCKILSAFFLLLASGIWFQIIGGIIAIISLPTQAKGEEKIMLELFGKEYENYINHTGRFFPKFFHKFKNKKNL